MDPLVSYTRERLQFMIYTYSLFTLMILVSLAQWVVLLNVDSCRDFFRDTPLLGFLTYISASLLILVFIFYEQLRFWTCVNMIFTIVIMEFICLGVLSSMIHITNVHFAYAFCLTLLVVVLAIIIASVCDVDLTLGVVHLFVFSFTAVVFGVYLMMMFVLIDYKPALILFTIHVGIVVILYMMYHAQAIKGSNYAEVRLKDHFLAALILYCLFVLLLLLGFFLEKLTATFIEEQIKKKLREKEGTTTAAPG